MLKQAQLPGALSGCQHVQDLIEFEGPLLTLFKSPRGELWLLKWCDITPESHIWIAFDVSQETLSAYLANDRHLLALIHEARELHLIESHAESENIVDQPSQRVTLSEVPESYLPTPESFYQPPISTQVRESAFRGSTGPS